MGAGGTLAQVQIRRRMVGGDGRRGVGATCGGGSRHPVEARFLGRLIGVKAVHHRQKLGITPVVIPFY